MPFEHELRVRYGECDPQGIVFNANYLAYFDIAVTELWRDAFGSWQAMVDRGVDIVVGEANVRFRAPARFDDVLTLRAAVASFGTTSLTLEIDIDRGDTRLIDGRLRQVCVDASTFGKVELPGWLRAGLEPYAA